MKKLNKIKKIFEIIKIIILCIFGYGILWSIIFRFPWLLIFTLVLFSLIIPIRMKRKYLYNISMLLLLIIFLFSSWFRYNPIDQLQYRIDHLSNKLIQKGPYSFTFLEKASIYLLGFNMCLCGMPLYPEIAKEQFLLQFPGPKNRVFHSSFAMKSEKIKEVVNGYSTTLMRLNSYKYTFSPKRVAFNYATDNMRVALALNPCYISGEAKKKDGIWELSMQAKVNVLYPQKSRIPLFSILRKTFYIEEGLYWMLQQNGWFFPYTAIWKWEVNCLESS